MSIIFACEKCGKRFEVEEKVAGKRGKCTQCGTIFTIPSSGSAAPPPPPKAVAPRAVATPAARPQPRHLLEENDDEEFMPRSPRSPVARPKRGDEEERGFAFVNHPPTGWWQFAIAIAVGMLTFSLFGPTGRLMLIGFIAVAGIGLSLLGGIGGIVVAFQESMSCGLMYLLVPFYSLFYVITRWAVMQRYFLLSVAGTLLLALSMAVGFRSAAMSGGGTTDSVNLAPAPGDSEAEKAVKELIASVNEEGEALSAIKDAPTFTATAPRATEIKFKIMEQSQRFVRSPHDERLRLRGKYEEPLKLAIVRMRAAADPAFRLGFPLALPPFRYNYDGTPAMEDFFPQEAPPAVTIQQPEPYAPAPPPNFNPPSPPPGGFRPPPMPPSFPPMTGSTVVVNVSGDIEDDEARKSFGDQLGEILKALPRGPNSGFSTSFSYSNGKLTYRLTPVEDTQAFADQIKFGKVTRVEGHQIDVVVESSP